MSQIQLDSTVRDMLKILARQKTITAAGLAQELHISEKAVRNRVSAAQDFLTENSLGTIAKKPRVGMGLEASPEQVRQLELLLEQAPSAGDRVSRVLEELFLLDEGQRLATRHLCDKLYLSGPTVLKTVKEAEKVLAGHNVRIINEHGKGFYIEAHENDYRAAFMEFVQDHLEPDRRVLFLKNYFYGLDLDAIDRVIQEVQRTWSCQFAAPSFENVSILCALACRRSQHRLYIPQGDARLLESYSEFAFAGEILKSLSARFQLRFNEEEVSYLTIQIICFGFASAGRLSAGETIEKYDQTLLQFVDELVDSASDFLETDLRSDQGLKESLAYHLRSAVFRLRHGDEQKNPLLPYIKTEYAQLFRFSWFAGMLFEKYFAVQMTEDELGYVVLLIQAALERSRTTCNVAVVADFSRSYASLVLQRIKKYLPEITNIRIISRYDMTDPVCKGADFILSRQQIAEKDSRIILIGNLLEDRYMTELIGRIRTMRSQNPAPQASFSPICQPLFHPDLVKTGVKASNKEEVLQILADEMVRSGFVKSGFHESVLKRERLVSTSVGDGVAIPHGDPEFVNQSRVAIAVLSEPVMWDASEPVSLVVLLGMKMSGHEEVKRAQIFYKELISLLEQPDCLRRMKQADSAITLYQYLIQ